MDNVLETNGVPLTVFGGAVPELAPEDLPEGASPFNQDVDYNPGSVFTRAGRANQITYGGLSVTDLPAVAVSVAGVHAPNEAPWSNPGNATLDLPATYAAVALNQGGAGGVASFVDTSVFNAVGALTNNVTTGPTTGQPDLVLYIDIADTQQGNAGSETNNAPGSLSTTIPTFGPTGNLICGISGVVAPGTTLNINSSYTALTGNLITKSSAIIALPTNGLTPVQTNIQGGGGSFSLGAHTIGGAAVVPSGCALVALITATSQSVSPQGFITNVFSDNHGNTWYAIGQCAFNGDYVAGAQFYGTGIWAFICPFPAAGSGYSFTFNVGGGPGAVVAGCSIAINTITNLIALQSYPYSQVLQSSVFNVSIPANRSIVGMQVIVDGHQSNISDPNAQLVANVDGQTVIYTRQLPLNIDGTVAFGFPTSNWNVALTLANLNSPSFKIDILATASSGVPVAFFVQGVKLRVWYSNAAANINWFKTYEQTNAQIDTLALDSNGILFDEQVNYGNGPGVLNSIFTNIFPNTFAKGVTFQDIEYIAFSNLVNGTDVPRQWNGSNLDRISMVGPGAVPTVASAGGSGGSNTAIQNITQYPQVEIRRIAWGTVGSPNDSTPGNLLCVYGEGKVPGQPYATLAPYNASFGAGTTVQLSGITNPFPKAGSGTLPYNLNVGPNANGTYTINQVTTGAVGGNEQCPLFTIPSPTTTWAYSADYGSGGPPPTSNWFYQSCLATVTLQAPLPNVGVGSTIQISGTGGGPPSGYDGSWTVLQAPNAVNMTINSVSLNAASNTATYSFTLAPGSPAPVPGQLVTVQNCLNGSGIGLPGIFNVTGVAIASVTGGNFSIPLTSPGADIPLQSQVGNVPTATAYVGGTTFVFDAGAIVGTKTGGNVVAQGQIGVGVRKACYCFLTRSGYITQPSPIATGNITSGSGGITVSGIATGPPNVVARIVCFTGAGGGNFFYIPQDVVVNVTGTPITSFSTIIKDNTSTTHVFNFSDAVLLSATAIDIPGNNLFNGIELGSSRGLMTYASRMVAWSEQQKITNLRNWSFDGGTLPGNSAPLGWSIDPTNGTGGSLNTNSPVFGWAYQIGNTSGSTQASWGMLTQKAYQDEFGVAIVQAATLYSVRICAQVTPAQASGNLIVDLYSPGTGAGTVLGSFSIPLSSMTTTMAMYTGTLLTTILQPVPADLVIRIWAQNILNGATILIDRVEPFQTLVPVNTTALKISYANNQETFDLISGVCGPAQNMQPINGVMEVFDLLYAIKEKSWFSTFDNAVTEPNQWNWKEVSNKVGTIGINSYDWGEGWSLTCDREGVHFFEGGEPIKISQEIQPLWDLINWQYGYTIWLRNDPEQKRFMVAVPISTPNAYMPEFPTNFNPTSPNVILMCNYRELNSGQALAQTGPIRATFSGRLMAPEPARKWSFWNIVCPYSDFISRANNQWPQWFGTGYSDNKIFQLFASQLSDDGLAINSFWISYGFVKPEMQDAKGLGLFRMEFPYFTILATGTGTLNTYVYPEAPQNQPYVLDPTPLPAVSQGDLEIGVNIKGQRFFIRVGTNAVGSAFRCSKMVVPLIADTWSPIRGYNAVTA